jgi:hypothetical protein
MLKSKMNNMTIVNIVLLGFIKKPFGLVQYWRKASDGPQLIESIAESHH